LTNIHDAPAEGNFCDNNGKAIKPQIVADYNRHLDYVDKGDRMTNSYSINLRRWKWTKKLFFHLFDLAILNSYILFSLLGYKKISHSDFRNNILGNLLVRAGQELNGRPPAKGADAMRYEERGKNHWSFRSATRKLMGRTRNVKTKCEKCDVAPCCDNTCFNILAPELFF